MWAACVRVFQFFSNLWNFLIDCKATAYSKDRKLTRRTSNSITKHCFGNECHSRMQGFYENRLIQFPMVIYGNDGNIDPLVAYYQVTRIHTFDMDGRWSNGLFINESWIQEEKQVVLGSSAEDLLECSSKKLICSDDDMICTNSSFHAGFIGFELRRWMIFICKVVKNVCYNEY